jgi:hypothetical protein
MLKIPVKIRAALFVDETREQEHCCQGKIRALPLCLLEATLGAVRKGQSVLIAHLGYWDSVFYLLNILVSLG